MIKPVLVKPLPEHRIYIKFSDGAEGEVDLSDLAGRGVFEAWKDQGAFQAVHIGPGRQIRWNEEIEMCPDSIYMRLTGKTPEEVFPALRQEITHA